MQINGSNLLQYTVIKKEVKASDSVTAEAQIDSVEVVSNINVSDYELANQSVSVDLDNINIVSKINYVTPTDTVEINGKTSDISDVSSVLTTEEINNACDEVIHAPENTSEPTVIKFSSTYKDLSQSTISHIKQVIYDLHHKSSGGESEGGGEVEGGGEGGGEVDPGGETEPGGETGGDGEDGPELEEPDPSKQSFIAEFNDTTSMFEYLNTLDSSITAESGITRAQLVALTQNENWEDSNYDFFGMLNRIFDVLDKNDNSTLSFEEIKDFIGDEIGSSVSTYKSKVNTYAAQIQAEYSTLSDQEKLEFALEKTREYLEAAGLTLQLKALDRLLSQTDLHNSIKVGNIAIADLNEGNTSGYYTLGSYMCLAGAFNYDYNGTTHEVSVWASDGDLADEDLGITLDISLLSKNWYELVDVLVHELTHATASQFYTQDSTDPYETASLTQSNILTLYNMGYIDATEYQYYIDNWASVVSNSDDIDRIFYLASCAWGEYIAYQTDANYVDSIAGDEFDAGNMTTAVDGPKEQETIEDHIDAAYNYNEDGTRKEAYEAVPDWKWWTYA